MLSLRVPPLANFESEIMVPRPNSGTNHEIENPVIRWRGYPHGLILNLTPVFKPYALQSGNRMTSLTSECIEKV